MTDRDAPTTTTLARRLGADPDRLERFATHHPDPDVEHVRSAFDGDDVDREPIAAWLAEVRARRGDQHEEAKLGRGGSA